MLLRAEGITIRFVSFLRETAAGYRAKSLPSDFIGEIYDGAGLSDAELEALESRYGPPALSRIAEFDVHLHHLYGSDEAKKVQIVGRALRYWERYFAEHGIGAVVVRDQASVATRTARHVATHLGTVRMMQIGGGPDDSHFTLYDTDTSWNWSELDVELAKGTRPLSPARQAAIQDFVASRVQPRRAHPMNLNLSVPRPLTLPLVLWRYWREERTVVSARDPVTLATLRLRRELATKRGLWRALRPFRQFDPPPAEDEKFVYFPLFHTQEAIHLLNVPYWAHHVEDLARTLADALPLGHKLYIKEHPVIVGDVPYRVLRRLRRHPRIRLLSPEIQSQTLIMKAKSVIVLQGTAGWETLLLRRPLIAFAAKPFYAKCPLAFQVENICDIAQVLPQAIAAAETLYDKRREEWLWFIDCVLRTAPPGVLETYEFPHTTPAQLQNVSLVARAIGRKIRGLSAVAPSDAIPAVTA